MMDVLVCDIAFDLAKVRITDREHAITLLPCKPFVSTGSLFRPFRGFRFDHFNQFANLYRSGNAHKQVNMIDMSANNRDDTTSFFDMVREHAKHLIAKLEVIQKWNAVLGRKYDVQPNLGVRLGHDDSSSEKKITVGPLALECKLYRFPSPSGWARKTAGPLARFVWKLVAIRVDAKRNAFDAIQNSTPLSSRHCGRRPCLQLLVVAAWLGMSTAAFGQTDDSFERLRVPVRALKMARPDTQMIAFPGYVSSRATVNPLSHYQRSRLGRWNVERDVDAEDSVFGIELNTPVGPIRIRYEVLVDGKSFRSNREETIDDLLTIARGEKTDAEDDVVSEDRARIVAYAKSRGDRANRYELRRRIADLANGPSLLWISKDFAADRSETHILFALLDANEDGAISSEELEDVDTVFDRCDVNADNRIELMEVHSRLKPRSARRESTMAELDWQSWDVNRSEHVEDLSINITFNESENKSKLLLDDCALSDPWESMTAEMSQIDGQESGGQAVLMSHPKVTVALTAEEETKVAGQVSVGVMAEGNALFRHLDQDGNWNLSRTEFNGCRDRILELDRDSDQGIDVSELPVLLRVSVARGVAAYRSLQEHIAFVPFSEDDDDTKQKLTPPEWFVSMDQDGDRTLSRKEFLGGRGAFDKIDGDANQLLSVEEALSSKLQ